MASASDKAQPQRLGPLVWFTLNVAVLFTVFVMPVLLDTAWYKHHPHARGYMLAGEGWALLFRFDYGLCRLGIEYPSLRGSG